MNGRNKQTGKPLARKTVVHHLSFISDVFSYAVKMSMVSDNPCSSVTVPRGYKKEKKIYTIEEIEKLFELVEEAPMKYRTFFVLAVYSGFRRGEMLGLEWKDIDWVHNVIRVCRTSNYTKANGYYTDTTKTESSQRSLKFPDLVMDLLKEYKMDQDELATLMGSKWVNTDRLFTKDDGTPMHPDTLTSWFGKFVKRKLIPSICVHSLRHINNMKTSLLKIRL